MRTNEQPYGLLSQICSLIFSALKNPLISIPFDGTDAPSPATLSDPPVIPPAWGSRLPPVSPAGMVSLFLGISLSLMLCGSVTFFIGFFMMPWVLGMVILLYFFGIVSCISGLCKAALSVQKLSADPLNEVNFPSYVEKKKFQHDDIYG